MTNIRQTQQFNRTATHLQHIDLKLAATKYLFEILRTANNDTHTAEKGQPMQAIAKTLSGSALIALISLCSIRVEAGIRILSSERRQEARIRCIPLKGDVYFVYTGGFWGQSFMPERELVSGPLSFSNAVATASAVIDTTQDQSGDVIFGSTTGFENLFVRAKANMSATSTTFGSSGGCPPGTFHTANTRTLVSFLTNSAEAMRFQGSLGLTTSYDPLASVGASLVCNGTTIFSVGAGTHGFSFDLPANSTCTYTVSGRADAEGSYGDRSSTNYNVFLRNEN